LHGASCEIISREASPQAVTCHKLSRGTFFKGAPGLPAHGLHRIRVAFGRAPATEFFIRITVPAIGTLVTATAAIPDRVTVLSLALRPDGTLDFNQNILRLPSRLYPDEPNAYARYGRLTYGRLLRLLQIGQKLYRSGELVKHATREYIDDDIFEGLRDLLYGKWLDPVLGCMGYYASRRARLGPEREAAENLWRYFMPLPDTRVIYGLENPDLQPELYRELLDSQSVPLLLESAQILADYAIGNGLAESAPIVETVRRATPGQPWSQILLPGPQNVRAAENNTVQQSVVGADS
jgi:hypothetical protein